MRLLVALNEPEAGAHSDVYNALNDLRAAGALEDSLVYPFLAELRSGRSAHEVCGRILELARGFQPAAILWSHAEELVLPEGFIASLRRLSSRPAIGYWDGDWYESPYKPIPRTVSDLARQSDAVFCQGIGSMTDVLRRKGCRDIRYVPASVDPQRFHPTGEPKGKQREFDVVLIGNYVSSRIPWKTFPGSRWRNRLAEMLRKNLGDRFAIFGAGWPTGFSKGQVPFDRQSEAYHRARLAIGVNNLHASYYFSNRLPIAMASGIPVLYNKEQGMERLFEGCPGIRFFRSTEEAWDHVSALLGADQSELDALGREASTFSLGRFRTDRVLGYMIDVLRSYRLKQETPALAGDVPNPWLDSAAVPANGCEKEVA